jgi:geranylgeranyl pyrophosphate synthase
VNQAAFLDSVDTKLRAVVAGHAAVLGVSPEQIGVRFGKRVRPRLVHACAEALGLAPETALPWAALVEIIHVASLIHDDVIDGAELRRGQPALRARDGNRRAVLGGDLLVSAAWLAASQELPSEVTAILARAMIDMTTAELRERELLWNPDASLCCYLRVIDGKTAALFAAAAEGTAVLAGASTATRNAIARWGRALGCAYQIQDDVRDYEWTPEASGKDTMQDLRGGIVTLPLIIALRRDGLRARAVRRHLVSRGRVDLDPRATAELLAESRALERSARLARRLVRNGVAALDGLVPIRALRQLTVTACDSSLGSSSWGGAPHSAQRRCESSGRSRASIGAATQVQREG